MDPARWREAFEVARGGHGPDRGSVRAGRTPPAGWAVGAGLDVREFVVEHLHDEAAVAQARSALMCW
ncbi:hypothetical protein SAV31267_004730 [Streptomyces avermitilis]|nr:hypothetical protein SAV31267_004730 [Streptomyces avermitilis]